MAIDTNPDDLALFDLIAERAAKAATLAPNYNAGRGKVFAKPRAAWGAADRNGAPYDAEQGTAVLNQSLGVTR